MPITHATVATATNAGTGDIHKEEWNADHVVTGGGLVLLEQHTASSSATLDFTTFISGTYDDYLFELVNLVPVTDNVALYMRAGTGGGPTYDTGNNYRWSSFRWSNSGSAVAGGTALGYWSMDGAGGIDNSGNFGVSGDVKLFGPQGTAPYPKIVVHTEYTENSINVPLGCSVGGEYAGGAAMTAVRFLFSSGNIASGTIRVYGIAKS